MRFAITICSDEKEPIKIRHLRQIKPPKSA